MEQGTAVYSAENHELPAFRTDAAFCLHGALFLLLWIHNRRLSGPDTETEVARWGAEQNSRPQIDEREPGSWYGLTMGLSSVCGVFCLSYLSMSPYLCEFQWSGLWDEGGTHFLGRLFEDESNNHLMWKTFFWYRLLSHFKPVCQPVLISFPSLWYTPVRKGGTTVPWGHSV